MKKLVLSAGLFALYQIPCAQCNQNITFRCNKGRNINNGATGQELPIEATISIENGKIFLAAKMNGETQTMEGEIKEVSICEWPDFLKNGKAQYKALTVKENKNSQHSIVETESENSYTKITFGSHPDTGSKLQFNVVEYSIAEEATTNNLSGKTPKKAKPSKKKLKKSAN